MTSPDDQLPPHDIVRWGLDVVTGELIQIVGLPPGCIIPEGQAVARSEYPKLFELLESWYGKDYGGSDETTFTLPDLRGRVIVGSCDPEDDLLK